MEGTLRGSEAGKVGDDGPVPTDIEMALSEGRIVCNGSVADLGKGGGVELRADVCAGTSRLRSLGGAVRDRP